MDQRRRYGTMLVRLGRLAEAVEYGLTALRQTDEALAMARALAEPRALADALRVAERGLTLGGWKPELARWTRDTASAAGDRELALRAARVALRAQLSVAEYEAVRELAGPGWPALRDEVLARGTAGPGTATRAGRDPLEPSSSSPRPSPSPTRRPTTTCWPRRWPTPQSPRHPAWVIDVGKRQAESIMNAGKSQHYDDAARWLARVRDAARIAGREASGAPTSTACSPSTDASTALVPRLKQLVD